MQPTDKIWPLFLAIVLYGAGLATALKEHPHEALFIFGSSYFALFLWATCYRTDQMAKGLILVSSGVLFVGVLGYVIGFNDFSDGAKPSVQLPRDIRLSYSIFLLLVGSTFAGTGGSVLANVAASNATDYLPVVQPKYNNTDIDELKKSVSFIKKLLMALVAILSLGLALAIFIYFQR